MADTILVRPHRQLAEHWEWLNFGATHMPSACGDWIELERAVEGKRIILLLPATAVLLFEIELPVKNNAQIAKALPFAVEDRLAEDVENYHLVWHKPANAKLVVAAVSHKQMAVVLAPFKQHRMPLEGLYPESVCLPYQAEGCAVLIEAGQATLRLGTYLGYGIETEMLAFTLSHMHAVDTSGLNLRIWSQQSAVELVQDLKVDYAEETLRDPLQVFNEGFKTTPALNLLTGPYASKSRIDIRWQDWLPALGITLIGLAIQLGALLNQSWQMQAQIETIESQTQALFKQNFPEIKRIVNVTAQADQQLMALQKQAEAGASEFMHLLYQTGVVLSEFVDIKLQSMEFAKAVMHLQVQAPDAGRLDQFKQQLQKMLKIDIQSTSSSEFGVEARLEIREN